MAGYVEATWPTAWTAPSNGTYTSDHLVGRVLVLPPDVAQEAVVVERLVRRLVARPASHGVDGLARFLLRSEAIASSRIEGLQVSPQQVALAELSGQDTGVTKGFTATAKLLTVTHPAARQALEELVGAGILHPKQVERNCADLAAGDSTRCGSDNVLIRFKLGRSWVCRAEVTEHCKPAISDRDVDRNGVDFLDGLKVSQPGSSADTSAHRGGRP